MATIKNFDPWSTRTFNLRWVWLALAVIVALSAAITSFVSVPADSVGVLIRLGRYQQTVPPGLRYKLPFGIDNLVIVPVQRQLKLEFGFMTEGATNPAQQAQEPEAEQSIVTGDLNMALVEWVVQYRIDDAKQYLFGVRSPADTLRAATESVMRDVIGDRTVDEVLTIGRQEIEVQTLVHLKALSEVYGLGVSIMQVQLKNVHPPRGVQSSFNEVNQAQQEREQMINVANGEYNKAVPKARGEADQRLRAAEGYALSRVNEARGDAERFNSLLAEYLKAPEVTRQRIYLETMAEVLPGLERKIILDDKVGGLLPHLSLDVNPKAEKPPVSE
ncbi:MAG TPA: FtsH protease activity modulator HflK [Chthoniobacterales bacterium]